MHECNVKVSFELLGYPNWNQKVTDNSDNELNASIETRKSVPPSKQRNENDH